MAGEKLVQKALQAAMEARAARHVADPAKRAENLAKWQAQTPKEVTEPTWYHGSLYEVPQFNNDRPAFVTQNPNFANTFASFPKNQSLAGQILDARLSGEPVPQPNVMPMHVRAENPFDYTNQKHLDDLLWNLDYSHLSDDEAKFLQQSLAKGDWEALERPYVQDAIKQLGHDAFFVLEDGNKNLAVMKPTEQFKSATGNLGTFDINSPRLDENRGGEVREHHADGERVGTFDIRAVDPRLGEYSLTQREEGSLPRAVALARQIIDAQPSVPVQGAPVDYSLSPQFAGMAHEMGKTPIGAVSVPVMGGNLHLQGGYDPLTKFEHYGARYTKNFAEGGPVDYQSNSEPVVKDGVINWGDPDNKADFFRAAAAMQRATELAKEVERPAPAAKTEEAPQPSRRTWDSTRPGVINPPPAPAPAPAAQAIETAAPPAPASVAQTPPQALPYAPVPSTEEVAKLTNRVAPGPDLTDRQRDLIVRTIAAETSGKSPEETRAIAHVILNRIQSGKFGATPEQVLFAKNQFEPWANPAGKNYPMRISPQSQRYVSSAQALDAALGGEDITGGASNFWGPVSQAALGRQPPDWALKTPGVDIGATRFHKVTDVTPRATAPTLAQPPAQPSVGLFAFGTNDAKPETALKSAQQIYENAQRAGIQPVFVLPNSSDPKFAPISEALRKFAEEKGIQFEAPGYDPRDPLHITPQTAQEIAKKYPGAFVAGDSNSWRLQRYGYGRPVADQKSFIDPRSGVTLGRVGAGSSEIAKAFKEYVDSLSKGRSEGGEVEREHHGSGERVVGKALDVIREKLAAGRALPEKERMMITHNAAPGALEFYRGIGGIPMPSTGIFKPYYGADRFGEVKLVGKPEVLAVPSETNPIISADAYTTRLRPAVANEFLHAAKEMGVSPIDLITQHLRRSNVRGTEGGYDTAAYLRAMIAPEFKTLDEVQAARNMLISPDQMRHEAGLVNYNHKQLMNAIRSNAFSRNFDIRNALEVARKGPDWLTDRWGADPQVATNFGRHLENLRTMPTEYFEGKPQRALTGQDFAGALVPEGRGAADTARTLEGLGIGDIHFYRVPQDKDALAVEQSDKLFQHFPEQMFAHGGGVQHFDKGGSAFRKYVAKLVGHTDAPTKRIEDWQWRPLADVATELELTKIPPHVRNFGDYMRDMSEKAAKEGLSARDLIKGYTTTRASIQRRATDADRLRQLGLNLPSDVTTIRPEGAWAEWLMTPMGKRYLDAASKGTVEGDAVADAIKIMSPFGRHETDIPDAMKWAAENLPGREKAASDLVARAAQGASSPAEWRQFTADIRGVGPSKSGFLASLYGRGDQPTLDARQIILNTGAPTKEAARYIARGGGEGGVEAVERLAARQQALGLQQPSKYDPFYQHLAHHAIWDKASNEMTTHGDVVRAMREADGGPVLADKYPTHYLPNVGRQVMQDGGVPPEVSMTRARKLALEEIGKSEDKPPMDPAVMGQNWANAVRRFRVPDYAVYEKGEPRRDPSREEFARPLELGARDVIGGAIAGDEANRTYLTELRRRAADAIVGSTGLPGSGTVGFGLADLPMVTGIPLTVADIGQSVREGDYLGAGAGAALPAAFYARKPLMDAGRRALEIAREYAPQLATAAGVGATLTSGDAEAAKAKAVQQAVNIVRTAERPPSSRFVSQAGEHGYFVPQSARERDPRLWHPISNTVLSRPLGEMQAEYAITTQPTPRKFITPQELEGVALIPALGDRTAGNALLRRVNEIDLPTPTEMQAGHSFMFGPAARGADFSAWASDPGVIAALANKTRKAAEAGYDPYLSYVAMGSRAGDYSHHMTDTLLGMLQSAKVPKATIAEFDRQMRENVANKWDPYTDFPGLKSKDLEAYLYGAGPAKARTKMAELMGQGQFQKAGMPDVGAARFAITDPALLHAADYSAGHSITKLDPTGRVIKEPAVPHKTYKVQLGADPEKGYVGGFEYDIPFSVMNKEWIDKLMAVDPKKYSNPSMLAYTYRMHQPTTIMTPEVVDRLSKYLESKKRGLIP